MKLREISNQNKRIAFYIAQLSTGGVGKMRIHLIRELVSRGINVDLLLGTAEGPYLKNLESNVRVIELGTTHVVSSLPRLILYLRKERPTAFVTDRVRLNMAALRARRLACVATRVYNSVHIPLTHKLETLKPKKRKSEYAKIQRFFPLNDRIIAVSKGVANDLIQNLKLPAEKIRTVYNPVITPEILSLATETATHPYFYSDDIPVILGAGRMTAQKDFSTLIRAFAILRKKRPCRLMILGQGREKSRLESLAMELGVRDDVEFPGFVTNPYQYMKSADLFVLSSAWEGFGNVLAEALAIGLPVISTDCRYGPREILKNGHLGSLVPVGDAEAMADAMEATLNNPLNSGVLQSAAVRFTAAASADGYLRAMDLIG